MRVVVAAHVRSSSSFFMRQIARSPLVAIVGDAHGELLPPGRRWTTRRLLDLPEDGEEGWDQDIHYADEFFKQFPNGAIKLISHAHRLSFFEHLWNMQDTLYIKLKRRDEASTIASAIACSKQQYLHGMDEGYNPWSHPARDNPLRFEDIKVNWIDDRMHILDHVHAVLRKAKKNIGWFPGIEIDTEDFYRGYRHPLIEHSLDVEFDFSQYITPSHYSEIFEDWKFYESEVRDILGPIPGLS